MERGITVLCGSTFRYLVPDLKAAGFRTLFVNRQRFPDGEIKPVVPDLGRGRVVYLQSTYPPAENLLEFFLTLDALSRLQPCPRRIHALVPYFGYARQDRVDVIGAPLSLEWIASNISPRIRLTTVDFHNPAAFPYFGCPVKNILPVDFFASFLRSKEELLRDAQVIAPDKGANKKNQLLAAALNLPHPMAQLEKKRNPRIGEVTIYGIEGKIQGTTAVLWDDVLTGGGTILKAIAYLKRRGIKKVVLIITHPLWFKVEETKMPEILKEVELLVTTDSIPVFRARVPCVSWNIVILPLINLFKKIISGGKN